MELFKDNKYPGRGIIIGKTPNSNKIIQIYWIMGRSINSRNRIFTKDSENSVKTEAYDISLLSDPTLIIYNPIRQLGNNHVVTNGAHTDTIIEHLENGYSFDEAVNNLLYEPDPPNFTPRISGIVNIQKEIYKLSIVKTISNNSNYYSNQLFTYNDIQPGRGYCITTYEKDGEPIPSYSGEPMIVEINNESNIMNFWKLLNEENKISILCKTINIKDGTSEIDIINKKN